MSPINDLFRLCLTNAPKSRTPRYGLGEWNLLSLVTPFSTGKGAAMLYLTLSLKFSVPQSPIILKIIHAQLCHPGVTRLFRFVKTKNLPYYTDEVKKVCSNCRICAELKPKFYKPDSSTLIWSIRPMERVNIDFKGPLHSVSRNKYLLTVIDEYSHFPFVILYPDVSASSVIKCLDSVFALCGTPRFVHLDRKSAFISAELTSYLTSRGIASSHSTPYHPIGNGQVEHYNGIVWKSIQLVLVSAKLPMECWESVLPDVLHSIRSLLSTVTNTTQHKRFVNFLRNATQGNSLPSWMSLGPVLLCEFVCSSKHDKLVEEVELTHANPTYGHNKHRDGCKSTVSLSDLAPCLRDHSADHSVKQIGSVSDDIVQETADVSEPNVELSMNMEETSRKMEGVPSEEPENTDPDDVPELVAQPLRWSTCLRIKPIRYRMDDE